MIYVNKVDSEGFIVEPLIVSPKDIERHNDLEDEFKLEENLIVKQVGEGLNTPKWDFTNEVWVEGKADSELLAEAKERKTAELKAKCEQAIIEGFTATNGHHYRTNRDDQVNMIGQKDDLMEDTTITEVMWKTEDSGYVSHTRDEWLAIYKEAFTHKQTQLFKYDTLKQEVQGKLKVSTVESVTW